MDLFFDSRWQRTHTSIFKCVNLEWQREAAVLIADYSNRIASKRSNSFGLAHSSRGILFTNGKSRQQPRHNNKIARHA